MSVNVIWSFTNGGVAISSTVDHGNSSNGEITTGLEIHLRHDGVFNITNCGLYIRAFSGSYTGDATAVGDLAELLEWGGASLSNYGGFQINQDAQGAFPSSGWPIATAPGVNVSGSETTYNTHRTGIGDSEANAITLLSETGATSDGTIQPGTSPNVRFKVRVEVPSTEDTLGVRQWDHVLTYDFTS